MTSSLTLASEMTMQQLAYNLDALKRAIHKNCPDLQKPCARNLNDLVSRMKDIILKHDPQAIHDAAVTFAATMIKNQQCPRPIATCMRVA
ncbi:hypothetical protein PT974_11059 [Cladobotryum mycophilum]|uniref:Uncharacterized protein n=1 Tax=Cladobotryum mycophilum TaxID=491253 RepID=A0ABR0SBI3_9HYPO